jgi:uncharacterized protein YkwD
MRLPNAALVLGAVLLALPAGAQARRAACRDAEAPIAASGVERARAAVLCLVNAERAARRLPAVARNPRLTTAAQVQTDDMLAGDFFAHVDLQGRTPGDRARAAGFAWAAIAENIATGQSTPSSVMESWMASPEHCRNILSPTVTALGVGAAPGYVGGAGPQGGTWTELFGRPVAVAAPSADTGPQARCDAAVRGARAVTRAASDDATTTTGTRRTLHARVTVRGRSMSVRGTLSPARGGVRISVRAVRADVEATRTVRTRADGGFSARITAPTGSGHVHLYVRTSGLRRLTLL